MYKMIVVDLDGTLLNANKEISNLTKAVLLEKQQAGYVLVLASGRPFLSMIEYAKQLAMDKYGGYIVAYNGAQLYDVKNNKVIFNRDIKAADARRIFAHLEKFDLVTMLPKGDYMYVEDAFNADITVNNKTFNIVEYEAKTADFLLCEVRPLSEKFNLDVNKILLSQSPEYLLEHYQAMSAPFVDEFNMVFSEPFFFEVTDKNASKGLAVAHLANKLAIDLSEIIGFGDDLNDLSFLEIIGHPVAMKNANPEVIKLVKNTCGSNNADGIGKYLEKLLQ